MKLTQQSLAVSLLAALSLAAGCSKNQFASTNKAAEKEAAPSTSPSEADAAGKGQRQSEATTGVRQSQTGTDGNPTLGTSPFGGDAPTTSELDPCAAQNAGGNVLILDLKSGWLAGDGGTFFQDQLDPKCPSSAPLVIEYYHITQAIVESNKDLLALTPEDALTCKNRLKADPEGRLEGRANPEMSCQINSLSKYTQIWLLSGDEADSLDITTNSPLFNSITSRIKERLALSTSAPVGLFFGAGLSNVSHSNALARALGISGRDLFSRNPQVSPGVFPSVKYVEQFAASPLKPSAEMGIGASSFVENFAAFKGLDSLFDYGDLSALGQLEVLAESFRNGENSIFERVPRCFADPITDPALTVVARDRCNQGTIGFLDRPGLRVLAEGNMARFYGQPNPQEYMTRLARFLAGASK